MKIIDVANIIIPSVNQKYVLRAGRLVLSPSYRDFKSSLSKCCRRVSIAAPYSVTIEIESYKDIDNSIKPILDCLTLAGVIIDDREVNELRVVKTKRKRGASESLRVYVEQKNLSESA